MSTIYVMTAANLFCGDHDPDASKHLTLTDLQLPSLSEVYADHHPGGSPVAVEVALGINKLEPTFKLAGWDPDVLSQFGLGGKKRMVYTAYGVITDKRDGREFEGKAVWEARLGSISPDNWQKGEMQSHEYALREVMHYELYFDGAEKYFWDFFTNEWRVDATPQNQTANSILRIPGAG